MALLSKNEKSRIKFETNFITTIDSITIILIVLIKLNGNVHVEGWLFSNAALPIIKSNF